MDDIVRVEFRRTVWDALCAKETSKGGVFERAALTGMRRRYKNNNFEQLRRELGLLRGRSTLDAMLIASAYDVVGEVIEDVRLLGAMRRWLANPTPKERRAFERCLKVIVDRCCGLLFRYVVVVSDSQNDMGNVSLEDVQAHHLGHLWSAFTRSDAKVLRRYCQNVRATPTGYISVAMKNEMFSFVRQRVRYGQALCEYKDVLTREGVLLATDVTTEHQDHAQQIAVRSGASSTLLNGHRHYVESQHWALDWSNYKEQVEAAAQTLPPSELLVWNTCIAGHHSLRDAKKMLSARDMPWWDLSMLDKEEIARKVFWRVWGRRMALEGLILEAAEMRYGKDRPLAEVQQVHPSITPETLKRIVDDLRHMVGGSRL